MNEKNDLLKMRIGGYIRWTAWALIWTYYHPEIHTAAGWLSSPSTGVISIVLYFVSGLVLELVYRKLVWGGINPNIKSAEAIRPESLDSSWTSIMDKKPPAYSEIEVYCADGIIRIAETHETTGGRLSMTIDYEGAIKKQMQVSPGNHRPTHWRVYIRL